MKITALGLKLVYSFTNLKIPLPANYVKHSRCNCQRLAERLLKQIQRIVRLQKDCRATIEVNDAFKLLSR